MIKRILIALVFANLVGCSSNFEDTYVYQPTDGVTCTIHTKRLKHRSDIESVFLYFELSVRNQKEAETYLDIGQIRASLDGASSVATHYDSLASVIPRKELLPKGESRYELYFVFPEDVGRGKVREFRIVNYGLSAQ